jgi:ribosomal protein S30
MAAKPLKGYKRLPGSAHRYSTPSGGNISEYQYRSIKARKQKAADGKPLFANYSQQRRFRESQDFMRLRFNIMSVDQAALVDSGSDLEAAAYELTLDNKLGQSGAAAYFAKDHSRFGELLAAQGAPDWYFWRFWYSGTK